MDYRAFAEAVGDMYRMYEDGRIDLDTFEETVRNNIVALNRRNDGDIAHDINKAHLESIGMVCLCAECADQ